MFNQSAIEDLGCYVYGLFDPSDPNVPFYIGKGRGNRVFDHVRGAALRTSPDDLMSLKDEQVDRIGRDKVVHKILRFGMTETEALKVEATLIDLVNHIRPGQLANAVSGNGVAEGIYTTAELEFALNATELITDVPVVLIKIERRWQEMLDAHGTPSALTRAQIYEAVKGDWVLSLSRVKTARCVLAVARGLVREVFVPADWRDAGYENRKCMSGDAGTGGFDSFVGRSVAHLNASGSQNPVRYLNC